MSLWTCINCGQRFGTPSIDNESEYPRDFDFATAMQFNPRLVYPEDPGQESDFQRSPHDYDQVCAPEVKIIQNPPVKKPQSRLAENKRRHRKDLHSFLSRKVEFILKKRH